MITPRKTSFISLPRISVIAGHTFTQLVRMKVFYFLIVFAILILAFKQLVFDSYTGGDTASEQQLRLLKSTVFFTMNLFSAILALSATALLIPKDIEDRTLYTILCKPVPRLDYLLGKLLGVLALIFVSLLMMDLLLSVMLHFNTQSLIASEKVLMGTGVHPEILQERIDTLNSHGLSNSIHYATLVIFFKAAVIASVALLISTFSTSTIFTLILTIIVVLIGMIQADAREIALKGQEGITSKLFMFLALVFPDFQLISVDDGVIDGKQVPTFLMIKITIVSIFYVALYTCLSWFTFRKKEF